MCFCNALIINFKEETQGHKALLKRLLDTGKSNFLGFFNHNNCLLKPGLHLVLIDQGVSQPRGDFSKQRNEESKESCKSRYGQMSLQWTKDEFSVFHSQSPSVN